MTQLPNYNIWIFRGSESTQEECDKRLLFADGWYVGHSPGSDVASGPYPSEGRALNDARMMTDTSGT